MARKLKKEPISRFLFSTPADFFTNSIFLLAAKLRYLSETETKDDEATAANEFMQLFVEFGQMKETNPADEQVQLQVRKLQDYITNHFYTCSDKILCGLGRMYAGGGELTENIDNVGGTGTAEFASKAIDIFYMSKK